MEFKNLGSMKGKFKVGDTLQIAGFAPLVLVEHLNKIGQPYVTRIDGESIGVNEGKYLFEEMFRVVEDATGGRL